MMQIILFMLICLFPIDSGAFHLVSSGISVSCSITESPETSCSDGIDNDCDGDIDGADSDCGGGGDPPTIADSVALSYASAANAVFTPPGGAPSENEIIVVLLGIISDAAITLPSGFTQIELAENNLAGKEHRLYAWWKRAGASEGTSYTFSWTGSVEREGYAYVLSGCTTSGSPVDINTSGVNENYSGNPPALSDTSTTDNVFMIYATANHDGGSTTPPTGFTERYDPGLLFAVADDILESAGSTGSLTSTVGAAPNSAVLVGFKP